MAGHHPSSIQSPAAADEEVDTIVSQAIDLAALEQTAATNPSPPLPINLETRFRKLKSFPGTQEPPPPLTSISKITKPSLLTNEPRGGGGGGGGGPSSSPSPMDSFSSGPSYKRRSPSPPPPQPMCCFGCRRRKGRRRGPTDQEFDGRRWGKEEEEILTDFGTFSFKEQQRKLNKALKEEEKASKEAAKVVEWVKQASARMDVSAIEELLSEDDELKQQQQQHK